MRHSLNFKNTEENMAMDNGASKRRKTEGIFDCEYTHIYENNVMKNERPLEDLAADIFYEYGGDRLDMKALHKTITSIQKFYNPKNYYHNFEHATHVLLNSAFYLKKVGGILNVVEELALLYSALIHDADHLGVSNNALIKKGHYLSKLYHNQSVAEMRSLTVGFEVLGETDGNFMRKFTEAEQKIFRTMVIELVLCTDVADPYKKKIAYMKSDDLSNKSDGKLNISSHAGKVALLMLVMRAADIGSSMQSFTTQKVWSRRIFLEMKAAGLEGDGPNVTPDFFFADQIQFMDFHAHYLASRLQATGVLDEDFIKLLLDNCVNNRNTWMSCGVELLNDWIKEENNTSSNHLTNGVSLSSIKLSLNENEIKGGERKFIESDKLT